MHLRPPRPTLFPYTTLFRSQAEMAVVLGGVLGLRLRAQHHLVDQRFVIFARDLRQHAVELRGAQRTLLGEGQVERLQKFLEDRKSTRLSSSHSSISYAVFCL